MFATLALTLAVSQAATHLSLAPWTGKTPVTVTSAATKFRLTVTGAPNAALHLHVTNLATGWIGAFCTSTVCAPMEVDVTLPPSGKAEYAFELIREEDAAPQRTSATIVSSDGARIAVRS